MVSLSFKGNVVLLTIILLTCDNATGWTDVLFAMLNRLCIFQVKMHDTGRMVFE